MSKGKRSTDTPHKKGPDRHDPAVKHDKVTSKHAHTKDKDIHEDRGIRKQKLSKPPHGGR
ncbi:MAG: hypothetical protein RLZZ385_1739 [Pseudomonadota bacterium]|jgi:hypothetical protein